MCLGPPRRPRAAPLPPQRWPLHRPAAQPPPLLQMSDKEDNISRLKFYTSGSSTPTAAPPQRGRPRQEPPTVAAPPKRMCFNLAPPLPAAADPGTVFPGMPAMFFAPAREASSSRYPQRNSRPPAWQQDYTFFAASCDKEVGRSSHLTVLSLLHDSLSGPTVRIQK
jgi:hypothetical protein